MFDIRAFFLSANPRAQQESKRTNQNPALKLKFKDDCILMEKESLFLQHILPCVYGETLLKGDSRYAFPLGSKAFQWILFVKKQACFCCYANSTSSKHEGFQKFLKNIKWERRKEMYKMPERREKVRTKEWKNKWIMHEGRKERNEEKRMT